MWVRSALSEPQVFLLEWIFEWFNLRFKTSNQDRFGRAWGGGFNGTHYMVIGAELAAQGRVERPGLCGVRVRVRAALSEPQVFLLEWSFGWFNLRFKTSNQDTSGRA